MISKSRRALDAEGHPTPTPRLARAKSQVLGVRCPPSVVSADTGVLEGIPTYTSASLGAKSGHLRERLRLLAVDSSACPARGQYPALTRRIRRNATLRSTWCSRVHRLSLADSGVGNGKMQQNTYFVANITGINLLGTQSTPSNSILPVALTSYCCFRGAPNLCIVSRLC